MKKFQMTIKSNFITLFELMQNKNKYACSFV